MKSRLLIPALLVIYHGSFLSFIEWYDGETYEYFMKHLPMYLGNAIFMVPVVKGYTWALAITALFSGYKAISFIVDQPYGLTAFNWLSIGIYGAIAILAGVFVWPAIRARMASEKTTPNQPAQHNTGSRPPSDDSSAPETSSSPGPRG